MRYFFDTEFIENGETIDLISIGVRAEDDREFYAQNLDCNFSAAGDFVARQVLPQLNHFDLGTRKRSCERPNQAHTDPIKYKCRNENCPWLTHSSIRDELKEFVGTGKVEFVGYYVAYDWVALCQLFGRMVDLPKGWPMYARDLKQMAMDLGNPRLPESGKGEHNALADARWNESAFSMLQEKKYLAATSASSFYVGVLD